MDDTKWPPVLDIHYYGGCGVDFYSVKQEQSYTRVEPAVIKKHWTKMCVEYTDPRSRTSIFFEDARRYEPTYLYKKRNQHDRTASHKNGLQANTAPPAAPPPPPPLPPAPPPALPRRVAPDGIAYTKQEFIDFFGRTYEWSLAPAEAPPALPPAAPPPAPPAAPPPAAPLSAAPPVAPPVAPPAAPPTPAHLLNPPPGQPAMAQQGQASNAPLVGAHPPTPPPPVVHPPLPPSAEAPSPPIGMGDSPPLETRRRLEGLRGLLTPEQMAEMDVLDGAIRRLPASPKTEQVRKHYFSVLVARDMLTSPERRADLLAYPEDGVGRTAPRRSDHPLPHPVSSHRVAPPHVHAGSCCR